MTDSEAPVGRMLRRRDVEYCTGFSTSQIYALMLRGEFPRPIKLSRRVVAWPESVVDAWLRERIAASRTGKAA